MSIVPSQARASRTRTKPPPDAPTADPEPITSLERTTSHAPSERSTLPGRPSSVTPPGRPSSATLPGSPVCRLSSSPLSSTGLAADSRASKEVAVVHGCVPDENRRLTDFITDDEEQAQEEADEEAGDADARDAERDDVDSAPAVEESVDLGAAESDQDGTNGDQSVARGDHGVTSEALDATDGDHAPTDEGHGATIEGPRATNEGPGVGSEHHDATEEDRTDEAPAVSTSSWRPDGAPCDACGSVVQRRWRDDGGLVCVDCVAW